MQFRLQRMPILCKVTERREGIYKGAHRQHACDAVKLASELRR